MKIRHFFFCSLLALDAGRLFVAPVYPHAENALSEGQPAETLERAVSLVEKRQLGGVLFKFYWEKEALQSAIARLKAAADYPLVLCIDCETGLAQRLPSYEPLPKPTTVDQAFAMGQAIGRQLKEVGLNMALAPVLDVNTNPQNPVIGKRALGSDPDVVSELGAALIRGIQSEGVLACGKHYPGHGDTHVDSHYGLPILDFDRKRLDAVELKPFRA
ncbi:MAG: glycoside hydrolase family 3 protein, partial [Chlamydiia bacterium]|nr:glycoside hydrolase family 3 protein [Chlamydiia bacterium]